jgi:hypothetical protein
MSLATDRIQEGILHERRMVRDLAARYFSEAYSPDPDVLPKVIEAIARDGRYAEKVLDVLSQTYEDVTVVVLTVFHVPLRACLRTLRFNSPQSTGAFKSVMSGYDRRRAPVRSVANGHRVSTAAGCGGRRAPADSWRRGPSR